MIRNLSVFVAILILSMSANGQDYEFKKYIPGLDSVLVKVFIENHDGLRDGCASIGGTPEYPFNFFKGQQRIISEHIVAGTCDGTCADTLSIVEVLIGDGHQAGNYDLPRNSINFISLNDKAAVVRTLPAIARDYGVNNVLIYTKDLHVGDTNIMRIIALSELYGGGAINFMIAVGGSALQIFVVPYPINLNQPYSMDGTARKISISWHEPAIPYWNLSHYSILQYSDTIRVSNITNCNTIRSNISKTDTIQELWLPKAGQNYFYAIAGYDSLNEFIALSESFRPLTEDSTFNLLQPSDDAVINSLNPDFEWENTGIGPYELWISTDSLFSLSTKYTGLTGNNYSISEELDDHSVYYWKVMSNDSSFSNQTQWRFKTNQSNEAPFTVNNLFPPNGSTVTSNPFKLQWQQAFDPGDNLLYQIMISTDQDMADTVLLTTLPNNWLIPSIELPEDALLWWVIKAIDSHGLFSVTEPSNFYVSEEDYPEPFSLKTPDAFETEGLFPSVKATETTTLPEFVWYPALDNDPGSLIEYTIYYSTDPDFIEATTVISGIPDTTYTPLEPLTEDKYYYWKVKATDNTGRSTWNLGLPNGFMVNETDMPVGPIEILYPMENQNVPIGKCNPLVIDYPQNDYYDMHSTHYTFFSNDSSFTTIDTLNFIACIPANVDCWCNTSYENPYLNTSNLSPIALDTIGVYYLKTQILSKKNTNPCYRFCEFNGGSTSEVRKFYISDTAVFSAVMWQNSYWGDIADTVESTMVKTVSWHSIGVNLVKVEYSLDNGITWILNQDSIPSYPDQQNNAYFRIPYINENSCSLKIRISDMTNTRAYCFDLRTYTIIHPTGKEVRIILPDTSAQVKVTSPCRIEFTKQKVDKVNLYYSVNGGLTYNEIITGFEGTFYTWTVPDSVSDICLIKAVDFYYPEAFFLSGNFSITPCRRIHVALTGDDITGTGSTMNPYLTVQKAITEYISYDSIKVASGLYSGMVDLDQFTGEVFKLSGGYDVNTWQPSEIPTVFENQGGTILKKTNFISYRKFFLNKLQLQNAVYGLHVGSPGGDIGDVETFTLYDVKIQNCTNALYSYRTGQVLDGVMIKNCTQGIIIYNYTWDNLSYYSNCIFDSITGYAVNISRWNPVNHHFTNCIFNHCTNGIYGDNPYSCHVYTTNSIFTNNGTSINYTSVVANPNDIHHNLFYGNATDIILNTIMIQPDSTNILNTDPSFNPEYPDLFLLNEYSPCIGAGIQNSLTSDFSGNPRPNPAGSNPDLGANESMYGIPTKGISGIVTYNNSIQTPLDSTQIILLHNEFPIATTYSGSNGQYSFLNLADGIYQIQLSSGKPWEGVNSTDALKVQRHAVGLELITEPVKLNAADVNNSIAINATDALQIKRRTVGLIDNFDRGDWTFAKPETTGDTIIINGTSVYQNFNALCVGDVNGSNIPGIDLKTNHAYAMNYEGTVYYEPGDSFDLPVFLNNQAEIGAITLAFHIPGSTIEISSVTTKNGEATWKYIDNQLNVAWSAVSPLSLCAGDTLLVIHFSLIQSAPSENIIIELLPGGELADPFANPITDATLTIPEIVSVTYIGQDQNKINVFPNPANDFLWISFTLDRASSVNIKMNDLTGRCLLENNPGTKSAGSHSWKIDLSSINPGTYMICIEYRIGDHKMVKCTKSVVIR